MKIIHRYQRNKAAIYELSVTRRLFVAVIAFVVAVNRVDPAVTVVAALVCGIAVLVAARAAWIKGRVSIWP